VAAGFEPAKSRFCKATRRRKTEKDSKVENGSGGNAVNLRSRFSKGRCSFEGLPGHPNSLSRELTLAREFHLRAPNRRSRTKAASAFANAEVPKCSTDNERTMPGSFRNKSPLTSYIIYIHCIEYVSYKMGL